MNLPHFKRFLGMILSVLFLMTTGVMDLSAAIQPMPLISRDVPAYTSSGATTRANNDSYDDYCWLSAESYPVWIAYDLSGVEVQQRQQVVVRWVTD
ncbi:MAG: hypothetical protein PVG41_09740, partial [Desulfobacteraceae bacterium]